MPERIASRVDEYFGRCLDYNIVGGKLARARTVSEVVRVCMGCEFRPESDQAKAALVLGWAIEILQAFFLIEDDVMDRGEVRRGQPCWYKVPDVGVANAINDGLLLEQVLYELIELNEYTKPLSVAAHRKLRDASMRTVIGQHLDTHPPASVTDFTRDQWLSVVRFKTAFYTFVLPCELGLLASGRTFSVSDVATLKDICLLLGELFQAQDDMLDCFGDPVVIGKVGRDIEEGKCTWLWYTAMEALSGTEKASELVSLYSSPSRASDPVIVSKIKNIYREINIDEKFTAYLASLQRDIDERVAQLAAGELQQLSRWLVESTVGRKK